MDTPEAVKPGTPVQCFAQGARRRRTGGWWRARQVRLVQDAEARDRYGRLLAYVYRASDGLFVNAELVRLRLRPAADDPAEHSRTRPSSRRLAVAARRAGRGLWSRC